MAGYELAIPEEIKGKFKEASLDCYSGILEACHSSQQYAKADSRLGLAMKFFDGDFGWCRGEKAGKWYTQCGLVKQSIGDLRQAELFANMAVKVHPTDESRHLLRILTE